MLPAGESKHFFDDNIMKCLPSYVYPCQRKYCIFSFHRKMFQKRRTASSFVLVTKYDSAHVPDLLLFQRALKKEDIFNPLSLTESEDGTAQGHDQLPVLEHLGLGLELHGADHEDDHAGHQECHAEVEK